MKDRKNNTKADIEDDLENDMVELHKIWKRLSPAERKAAVEFTRSEVKRKRSNANITKLIALVGVIIVIAAILYVLQN